MQFKKQLNNRGILGGFFAVLLASAALSGIAGCDTVTQKPQVVAGAPGPGQQLFASDDEAAKALIAAATVAAKDKDRAALDRVFGPAAKELVSGDKVADENALENFSKHAAEHYQLEKFDASRTVLDIGKDNWPFPIPIVRTSDDRWFFDTGIGQEGDPGPGRKSAPMNLKPSRSAALTSKRSANTPALTATAAAC